MKKVVFLFFSLLLLQTSTSKAQILIGLLFGDKLNSPKTEFGLNASYNYSQLSDLSDPNSYNALGFGLFLDFKISKNWVLATGLFFKSPRGGENLTKDESYFYYLDDSLFENSTTRRRMNYLDLPIMIRIQALPRIGLAAGFSMGYLISSKEMIFGDYYEGTFTYERTVVQFFNRFNVEAIGGIHYHFKGDPGAQIRLNYLHGITNIYNDGKEGYTKSFQISVLVPIKFGVSGEKSDE